jgi:hypothetical protein
MQLTQRILDYENRISESDYLDELAESVGVDDLFAAIVELLQSQDEATLSTALLFVRDLVQWEPDENRLAIKKHYPDSAVVRAVEALLRSDNHWIRQQVGTVLGKILSYGSVPAMVEAFHYWYDRDPLMFYFFLGEMSWLGAANIDELVEQMLSSQCFVTRWVGVSFLGGYCPSKRQQQRQFDHLRNDPVLLVRQEAEYEYRCHLLRVSGRPAFHYEPSFRITERQAAIDQKYQPVIALGMIRNIFHNHMSAKGMSDYTIPQLEAFIEQYVAYTPPQREAFMAQCVAEISAKTE